MGHEEPSLPFGMDRPYADDPEWQVSGGVAGGVSHDAEVGCRFPQEAQGAKVNRSASPVRIEPEQRPLFPAPIGTLENAQARYRDGLREGTDCPCCGRYGKVYRRKFNSKMARVLMELAKLDVRRPGGWVRVAVEIPYGLRGSDYGLLPYWGFVEAKGGEKDDGNPHSGQYRITATGRGFVNGMLAAKKYVYTYNDRAIDVDEPEAAETLRVRDALGAHFNYTELMREIVEERRVP